jgi:hypothetical protein
MAASMTITYDVSGPVKRILATWVSDASGDTAGTTAKVSGYLLAGVTDPGTAAPTANYDIVITDPEGANVLGNCDDDLIDRHTTTTERVDFAVATATGARPAVCDALTITVSNAGDSKGGQVILYVDGYIYGQAG